MVCRPTSRRGFTLIELLVVITIIALLISLLLAAVFKALSSVDRVKNRNDISQISAAIAAFKRTFEVDYMPSKINLAAGVGTQDYEYLHRVFPHLPDGYNSWAALGTLEGDQCIVFFLGGLQQGNACYGFSSNPKDPWAAPTPGEIRKGPFYDFKLNRLQMKGKALTYLDVYGTPYAYFSTYGTSNSYNGNDCSFAKPYMQSATEYVKPDSFQIISAGTDRTFGPGGLYNPATLATGAGRDDIANFATGPLGSSN